MTVFWGLVVFCVTSLLQRRLNWNFYTDPKLPIVGLLAFTLVTSLVGGCYWGVHMWKFYEAKRKKDAMERPEQTTSS